MSHGSHWFPLVSPVGRESLHRDPGQPGDFLQRPAGSTRWDVATPAVHAEGRQRRQVHLVGRRWTGGRNGEVKICKNGDLSQPQGRVWYMEIQRTRMEILKQPTCDEAVEMMGIG